MQNKGIQCKDVIVKNLKEYLYLFTLISWFLWENIQTAQIESIAEWSVGTLDYYADRFFLVILVIIIVFIRNYSLKEKITIGICTVVFAVSAYRSGYYSILSFWLFIVAAKGENLNRIILCGYISLFIFTLTVIILYFCGVVEEFSEYHRNIMRHSLGFYHPNTLGLNILELMAYRFYLRNNRLNIVDYFLSLLDIVFTYFVPNSLSALVGMVILLVLSTIWRITKKWEKVSGLYLMILIVACVFCNMFSVAASILYSSNSSILVCLDQLFTGRLSAANTIYNVYGIKFFGNAILPMYSVVDFNGQTISLPYLDSSYMNLLIRFGVAVYLIHTFFYVETAIRSRHSQPMLLIIWVVFATHGIMEITLYELRRNLFLIAISIILFSNTFSHNARN